MDVRTRHQAPEAPAEADPHQPLNPPEALGEGAFALPAYLSNGLLGLRILGAPLQGGLAMLNGFVGEHPDKRVEASARAPFPLGGDLRLDGVRLSHTLYLLDEPRQAYDFATGELTTRATFQTAKTRADIETVIFCSRPRPSLACQEIRLTVDAACRVQVSAGVDARGIYGREVQILIDGKLGDDAEIDGALRWASHGDTSSCGLAFVTELLAEDSEGKQERREQLLETIHAFDAKPGRTYRLRQMTSVVSEGEHQQPEMQAARLAAMARRDGFDTVRDENRAAWRDLWKGRIRLVGAEPKWQELADAAVYYLNASTHASALASTSIFGLATWIDYHHYYGHVMWDIETFVVPPMTLLQPHAAVTMLNYRADHQASAHKNAALRGRRGLQFPWESGRFTGQEAAPLPGSASWYEDHVSVDVARAFAFYADVTGDARFLRERAAPVIAGVADWLVSRVERTARGYEIKRSMGVAERKSPVDNPAFTNMSAKVVLSDAARVCALAGMPCDARWTKVADGLVLPMRGAAVVSHDGYRKDEEKGATPDPLLGVFPVGFELPDAQLQATLEFYLGMADDYIGSPMLSALYGVWAAWAGDRRQALKLLDEGYAQFSRGRFRQILEYRPDRHPDEPQAGPFFANMGGFLISLLLGFPGLQPNGGDIESWPRRKVVLPAGWDAIEVDRLWIRGQPMRLIALQGEMARLEPLAEP